MRHHQQRLTILEQVENWTSKQRADLAEELLAVPPADKPLGRPSFSRAYGIARPDFPPPTDKEVKQWIHEHRTRKYGS